VHQAGDANQAIFEDASGLHTDPNPRTIWTNLYTIVKGNLEIGGVMNRAVLVPGSPEKDNTASAPASGLGQLPDLID
jgi:hypothetical protein